MADNTSQSGADLIATDELLTINGSSVSGQGVKAQRVKIGYGDDSDFRDASNDYPLPIFDGPGSFPIGITQGDGFQTRVTGSGTASGVSLALAQAALIIYVTDIMWSNSGATASMLTLVAASAALSQQDIWMAAGSSGIRSLKRPWKISSAVNIQLNYSISAATTSWFFTLHGYYGV